MFAPLVPYVAMAARSVLGSQRPARGGSDGGEGAASLVDALAQERPRGEPRVHLTVGAVTTCTVGDRTLAYGGWARAAARGGERLRGDQDDWDPAGLASGMSWSSGQPGHGVAGRRLAFTADDLAADVAGLIDALGLSRPTLLGWSMGGCVALALALSHPGKVSKLVLLSTSGESSAFRQTRRCSRACDVRRPVSRSAL